MKQFKKLIACVLAATLVLGSTTVVFGADNSQTGSLGGGATLEGTVNREVFSVEAPTVAYLPDATGNVYNFILDPEGLIDITDGGKYGNEIDFKATGSMYFQVSGNAYDVKSQEATVTNKSSVDVTVTLNATVTVPASNAAVTFDEDGVWAATDTSLGIYLAIDGKDVNNASVTGAAIVANGGAVTTDLASYGAYKVIATNGGYEYAIDESISATADTYTFWLTGACNTNANWSGYDTTANPTVELVWTVKVKGAEGSEAGDVDPTFAAGTGKGSIVYTAGKGAAAVASIVSIKMTNSLGEFDGYNANADLWTAATTSTDALGNITITMKPEFTQWYEDKASYDATVTYKLADGSEKTVTVKNVVTK